MGTYAAQVERKEVQHYELKGRLYGLSWQMEDSNLFSYLTWPKGLSCSTDKKQTVGVLDRGHFQQITKRKAREKK